MLEVRLDDPVLDSRRTLSSLFDAQQLDELEENLPRSRGSG
jgi:hypothetical protein